MTASSIAGAASIAPPPRSADPASGVQSLADVHGFGRAQVSGRGFVSANRRPVFDYVTSIDPALSTFGWKIIGLAHLAILVPLFAAFLPAMRRRTGHG